MRTINRIEQIIHDHGVMLLDGATATELEARGCDIADDLWSSRVLFQQPELIRQVHLDYLAAGSDIATSVSYQATVEGFRRHGIPADRARELIALSVRLAVEARDSFWSEPEHRVGRPRPVAAASVGPYGAFLADGSEYRGDYGISTRALADFHRDRLALLLEAGAELVCCETLPCLEEAQVLTELLEAHPESLCWLSFSCRDGAHISDGTPIERCVTAVEAHPRVAAVGINCVPPQLALELVRRVRSATAKPVVVYPNSGEEYDPVRKIWQGASDGVAFQERAQTWYDAGARIIGGCCRTGPAHIRQVAALLRGGNTAL